MLVEQFLDRYYLRYPDERSSDPSIEELYNLIGKGIHMYLDSNILILYSMFKDGVVIKHYWCDAEYEPRTAYKQHKKFVRLFNCNVYIGTCKVFYNRKYIYDYSDELSMYIYVK